MLFLLLCSLPTWARAQDPQKIPIIRARVEMVNVLCTVQDGRGRYITDLTKDDVTVYENDVPQQVQYFAYEHGPNAQPLTVMLLVDTSGSVKDKLDFEQVTALEFLQAVLRPKTDMAAVVQFDSEINLVQDFTFDVPTLQKAIDGIRAGGGTKLYDAIYVAVDELLRHETGRHVIVILSDGQDTNSTYDQDTAIQMAQKYDTMIFGIGIVSREGRDFGVLKDFARATGGSFFKSNISIQQMRAAFDKINGEIKNQYSIAYVSSDRRHDGEFREIKIKVNRRGLEVRHRKGYFAPKPDSEAAGR